ncbi:uncharacterized protein LOC129244191 [Anastrepha obliqua]|uniref:uncharacterized protein LOC129244191 n=1 Tax=Anastrepha obliqua TaxID=95512 RepID=UPI002409C56C|nr:uncharacterized protein LOC129244191 [Anastrepha obliqua]
MLRRCYLRGRFSPVCTRRVQQFALRNFSKMTSDQVKVQVQQGVVVGRENILPNGEPYYSFQGVPYAVPPLGNLRFRSPVPLERFDTPQLDCTRERKPCHQREPLTNDVVGSEDCLHLNVYAPAKRTEKPLPVMVWIHGGGFFFGSCKNTLPLSLVSEDVIVVTLNYRLGAWGFLCLPEEGIFGNAGLKDQRLALHWVHDNIAHFNGDPDNVTLFGESAGAACVHLHTMATHAHTLFHKAIMQSGTANMEWVFQQNPEQKVRRFCELLGCQSRNTQEMLNFLQSKEKVTALDVLVNTFPVLSPDERRRGLPITFRPVIEDSSSSDKFISMPVMERMRQTDTLAMPTIMGYNSAEGILMLINAVRKIEEINQDLTRFVPRNIPLPIDHKEMHSLAEKLRTFYFNGHKITHEMFDAMTNLLTDYHFMVDLRVAVKLQLQYQPRAPIYFYRYDYCGGRDLYKRFFRLEHIPGACHADELHYLFQAPGVNPRKFEESDRLNVERLSAMWANFARHGDPTPPESVVAKELGFTWTPLRKTDGEDFGLDCLTINRDCRMQRDPDRDRMEFWEEIYRNYPPLDYSRLSAKYLPLSLLEEGVIVVTLNYRLGAWGFLCLPEAGIWGNAGLKDQRLALQWVHENIENFNGDPNNVTLFGESAGAVCVQMHMLTSQASKFFHKAIMQSGSANIEWSFQRKPKAKVRHLCELLGCKSKGPKAMLEFLQSPEKVTPEAVLRMSLSLLLPDERRRGPPFPLRPVLEDSSSPDAFISSPVLELMRQRDTLTIPTMIGYNSGEGLTLLRHSMKQMKKVDEDLQRFVPRNISLSAEQPEMKVLTQKVREFYFGGRKITLEHLQSLCNLVTDYHFLIDIHLATELQAIHQPRAPLYAYRFDYTGGRDFYKRFFAFEHLNGACHADELHYLFQLQNDDLNTLEEYDAQITKRLSAMWANFARHGEPTPQNSNIRSTSSFKLTRQLQALQLLKMFQNIFSRSHRYLQPCSALKYYSQIKSSKEVKVQVRQGVVVGREERLPNGKPFHCFQGIPYAVPPLGKLRFQPPVPLEQFDAPELDCTSPKDPCYQRDSVTREPVGSENCLHLNVYAPVKSSSQPLPVMVWIHGGGFLFGHGQTFLPLSLVSEDVIVVSINYRLGLWGFACLPEAGIWGNAGLKDQRQALVWVQENISNFNGDPNNVTLFGESSGACCVSLHTLVSHAHKLFHKAIMQSGTANSEWVFQRKPREKMYHLCDLLGCQSKDPKEMLKFLQSHEKVTPEIVLGKTGVLLLPDERRRGFPFPLRPVLEDSSSPDAFIDTPVLELMQRTDTLTMPTIIGYNSTEALTILRRQNLEEIEGDLARFVPRNIPLPFDHPEIQSFVQNIREFYFGGRKITQEHLQGLANLLTDYHFLIDIHLAIKLQAIHQPRAPLYAYRFNYTGGRDFFKRSFKLEHLDGACHGDELNYLFQNVEDDTSTFSESDAQTTKRLSAMWANFARHGNPTPKNSDIAKESGIVWTPVKRPMGGDDCKLDYLSIDRKCSMQQDPDNDRIQFWQNVYNKYKAKDYSIINAKL